MQGYRYAAVHNGGACFCKDSYGQGGAAPHEDCGLSCSNLWGEHDCGGYDEYAIYNTRYGEWPEMRVMNTPLAHHSSYQFEINMC